MVFTCAGRTASGGPKCQLPRCPGAPRQCKAVAQKASPNGDAGLTARYVWHPPTMPSTLHTVVAAAALLFLLFLVVLLRLPRAARAHATEPPPCELSPLLSAGELEFFHALRAAVGDRCHVSCEVRLADLVHLAGNAPRAMQSGLNQKHVDFVICDPRTMTPLRVVELDDRSHDTARGIKRDRYVDAVLGYVGLPITRVRAASRYAVAPLRALAEG